MKTVRRNLLLFSLLLAPWWVAAETYPSVGNHASVLTIYSTTDTGTFESAVREFQRLNPGVAVRYEELGSTVLYERFLEELARAEPRADLLLSSAMDLQLKLVNDGHAATHVSANARTLPSWARWRDQAFGFTFEPAVMVFNLDAFVGRKLPQTRGELIELLRRESATWRGRIGTYDIASSSVGYLLASQDARQGSEFGALVETMRDAQVKIERRTAALLDRLESGELAIGYNLLGSYAQKRAAAGAPLAIVYPRDYTLVVTRTAVLPASAPNAAVAHRFLEYLVSIRGQRTLANDGGLPAIRTEVSGRDTQAGIIHAAVGPLRPVVLGPGLLVYLDAQKKQRFLASWHGAVGHTAADDTK
jgi:iron(III) transport system substrate-binding protein